MGKWNQRKALERKEQYRQVRAHVKRDNGRMQAYGWSLPARIPSDPSQAASKSSPSSSPKKEKGGKSHSSPHVPVPVPVYCRPLTERDPGMKVTC